MSDLKADLNVDPSSSDSVAQYTKIETGTIACPDCYKLKTYTTPVIARGGERISNSEVSGWINARIKISVTNITEGNIPRYSMIADLTNNGYFINRTYFFIKNGNGLYEKLDSINKYGMNCFSNIATGCSWYEQILLPTAQVEKSLLTQMPLTIMVGDARLMRTRTSIDGYSAKDQSTTEYYGVILTIPLESLQGLQKKIIQDGGVIPSLAVEQDWKIKQENQAIHRQDKIRAKKMSEKPLKQEVGVRICQKQGPWKIIGYVEKTVKERIQIRVSDMVDGSLRPGSFREQIIWDDPDNWDLC